ncbi:MAG: acyl carrier protein [Minicystis sp.]
MAAKVRLHEVVARALRVPAASVSDETSPATLRAWNSLRHLELMTEIEDACGVRFSTADIVRAQSVGQIRRLLQEKGIEVD